MTFALTFISSLGMAHAEPYISASLGWAFNQKLSGIKGDENLNYPGPMLVGDPSLFLGTNYSDIKLKDVLQGGVKTGYYFESLPSLGVELEANYSQPNMKRQNVTISNPGIGSAVAYPASNPNENSMTEDQMPAKVQLFQFNLNGLYRYQGFKDFTPYIGGGPSLNIIKITGTGYSGIFVDPPFGDSATCFSTANPDAPPCTNVHDTSVNLGVNFKVGAEYHLDKDWGLGAEYHYNWSDVDVTHFRSANNLKADLEIQSVNFVLTRHF